LAGDATAVVGADVYVGYGTNFAELISSARYAKKYTITNGIKVFSTSYENAKSQPQLHMPQRGASNLVTTAFGWADFFQTGSKTLFTATYRYEAWIQTMEQATGDSKYLSDFDFWNKNGDGTYTKILSFPNAGCLHPRKAVVADFNQDGYPDLFISCHGYDTPPYPGERSKLVMSNGHGGFTVRDVGTVGYWHTASAADVNGDGYPDIVVSNQKDDPHTFFLINNRDGTFSADKTRIVGLNQVNFAMELVDVDGDGNIDLIGGYDESNQYVDYRTITRVMYGDLLGHFGARSDIIPSIKNRGIVLDFTVVTNNGVRGIFVCRTSDSTSLEGFYKSSTLQWVDIKTMASSIVLDETKNIFPSNPFWWTNANKNGQNGVTPMLDDYSTFTQFISH
jgi:hypothetical protein